MNIGKDIDIFLTWLHNNKYNTKSKWSRGEDGNMYFVERKHWKTDTNSSRLYLTTEQVYQIYLESK